jgi:DNA phosphorothioation-dependent restriction protein DptG
MDNNELQKSYTHAVNKAAKYINVLKTLTVEEKNKAPMMNAFDFSQVIGVIFDKRKEDVIIDIIRAEEFVS